MKLLFLILSAAALIDAAAISGSNTDPKGDCFGRRRTTTRAPTTTTKGPTTAPPTVATTVKAAAAAESVQTPAVAEPTRAAVFGTTDSSASDTKADGE